MIEILLINYNDNAHIQWFPTGLAYIASQLEEYKYTFNIFDMGASHNTSEELAKYIENSSYDVVCFGFIAGYYQYQKAIEISEAINKVTNRKDFFYIIAGHGPSPEPGYFLNKLKADICLIGEAEETIIKVLQTIGNNRFLFFNDIEGIAYFNKDKDLIINNKKTRLSSDIINNLLPAYHLFDINYYRLRRFAGCKNTDFVMPMITSRGCPYKCNFCYRMNKGYRKRSIDSIMTEIKWLVNELDINYIYFFDELLMSSEERAIEICDGILSNNFDIRWSCNGRLNIVNEKILRNMKKAGCVFINYGIEAFDETVLKNMNKHLDCAQIEHGIKLTQLYEIGTGLNMLWGNIGDDNRTLEKAVNFLLQYDDHSQLRTIRPVTPYPGSPLYYYAIEQGLLEGVADFYENKHINSDLLTVNFTNLSDEDFYHYLFNANITLLKRYAEDLKKTFYNTTYDLYFNKNVKFRGYRHI